MECIEDPFETPETLERASWYRVNGIPDVRIDGKYSVTGALSCSTAARAYREKIRLRKQETNDTSPVEITGSFLVGSDELSMRATFRLIDPAVLTDLRATLLVYEDSIYRTGEFFYDNTWHHITRKLYYEDIALANPGDEVTVSTTVPRGPDWDPAHLHGVAFLQTTSGQKEIIQGAMLPRPFTFALAKSVRSVPGGSGTALYDGLLTNTGPAAETFTIELGSPFGDWQADFKICGETEFHAEPVEVILGPGESCDVSIRVRTDDVKDLRAGSLQISAPSGAMEQRMRLFNATPAILIVDDDRGGPEEAIGDALAATGYLFEDWGVDGVNPEYWNLAGFDVVIWDTRFHQPSDPMADVNEEALMEFMDEGGALFLTSQGYLGTLPRSNRFLRSYLGVTSWVLDQSYDHLRGIAGDPIGDGLDLPLHFDQPWLNHPDHVVPGPTADIVLRAEGGDWNGMIRNQALDRSRSVFMPCAFAGISSSDPDPNNRRVVLQRILQWLVPGQPGSVDQATGALPVTRIVGARPNPFYPSTEILFTLSGAGAAAPVRLEVFDLGGRRIASLFEGSLPAGEHARLWKGLADGGRRVESGVYFARLTTREGQQVQKLILLKN